LVAVGKISIANQKNRNGNSNPLKVFGKLVSK
jgi:hypothetical protein